MTDINKLNTSSTCSLSRGFLIGGAIYHNKTKNTISTTDNEIPGKSKEETIEKLINDLSPWDILIPPPEFRDSGKGLYTRKIQWHLYNKPPGVTDSSSSNAFQNPSFPVILSLLVETPIVPYVVINQNIDRPKETKLENTHKSDIQKKSKIPEEIKSGLQLFTHH
jgi:hypothetical protein